MRHSDSIRLYIESTLFPAKLSPVPTVIYNWLQALRLDAENILYDVGVPGYDLREIVRRCIAALVLPIETRKMPGEEDGKRISHTRGLSTHEKEVCKADLRSSFAMIRKAIHALDPRHERLHFSDSNQRALLSSELNPRSQQQQCSQSINQLNSTNPDSRTLILNTLAEFDFSDSGYTSASSLRDDASLIVDEVTAHLLNYGFLRSLLARAAQIEANEVVLLRKIRDLLKVYGLELEKTASEAEEHLVARQVTRHAAFIARALAERNAPGDVDRDNMDGDEATKRGRQARIETLLQKRGAKLVTGLRNTSPGSEPGTKDVVSHDERAYADAEMPHFHLPKLALDDVKLFMISGPAFNSFLGLLCQMVYADPSEATRAEFFRTSPSDHHGTRTVHFDVTWELSAFIQAQNDETTKENPLNSMLVLCGNLRNPYATSCANYMKFAWPKTGDFLLDAIRHPDNSEQDASEYLVVHDGQNADTKKVVARGEGEFLIDIAQQLCWLAAAFRLVSSGNLYLSRVLFHGTTQDTYSIMPLPLKVFQEDGDACWAPLFRGTVLVIDYPVPARGEEIGVELPFDLMASLAGVLYPMSFDGGIYLKGLFTSAIPHSSLQR